MRCAACGKRAVHLHHLVPKQVLRREARRDRLTDPRNLLPLCFDCHFNHESWSHRLERHQVPAKTWEFAKELGEWAVVRLERDYPVHVDPPSAAGALGA